MFAFSPDIVVRMDLLGSRVACISVGRMARASKLWMVLSVPEVRMALERVERARAAPPGLAAGQLRIVFLRAGILVAMGALRVIVNRLPTTRRFGQGPQACPFGCFAVGCDDLRHLCSCLVIMTDGRRDWVRLGRLAGGDITTVFMPVPTDERMDDCAWRVVVHRLPRLQRCRPRERGCATG